MLSYEFCSINGCTLTKWCEVRKSCAFFSVVKYSSKIKI